MLHAESRTIYLLMSGNGGEPDLKNFVAKLKVLNLGQVECRCKLVLVDCLVVKKS